MADLSGACTGSTSLGDGACTIGEAGHTLLGDRSGKTTGGIIRRGVVCWEAHSLGLHVVLAPHIFILHASLSRTITIQQTLAEAEIPEITVTSDACLRRALPGVEAICAGCNTAGARPACFIRTVSITVAAGSACQ